MTEVFVRIHLGTRVTKTELTESILIYYTTNSKLISNLPPTFPSGWCTAERTTPSPYAPQSA
jgi:hypothetical protein